MILFPCEHCGKVICTDEQSASQQAPCPYCHRQIIIPSASSADCHLIYRDPRQPNGEPISSTELQEQLEAGNLNPSDLIWINQAWRPLYQVLNMPLSVGDLQAAQPELAIHFEELAPLSGFAPLPKRGKRKKAMTNQNASAPATQTPAEHVSIGQRIKKVLFAIVALAVLFFGVVRGLRIYNYATKRFANVIVYNGTDQICGLQFPFSGFDPNIVFPTSFSLLENLVVGLPCHKSLNIWYCEEDDISEREQLLNKKADQSISVTIHPNHDTLVNLGQTPFPAYRDFDELRNFDLLAPEQLRIAMARQIAENAAPQQAQNLFQQAQNCLKEHLVKMVTEPVITDQDYDFTPLNINPGDRVERPLRTDDDQRPYLVKPEAYSINHHNGAFIFKGEAEIHQLTIGLPPTTYHIPIQGFSFNAPAEATLAPLGNGGLRIDVNFHLAKNTSLPANYAGIWKYHAELSPEGVWTWRWLFTPPGQKTQEIAPNGTVTVKGD